MEQSEPAAWRPGVDFVRLAGAEHQTLVYLMIVDYDVLYLIE